MGCGASVDYKKKNIEDKASWNESFTKSVRADLVQMRFNPIEEDFDLNLERELGKGGCGVVVVGEKRDNQEIFAIKLVMNSKGKVRANREVLLLKDLDHPNVVRLFSVYDNPSTLYFVMEICTGGHLGTLLNTRRGKFLDEEWARMLCRQMVSAVSHIHERGIAHRDIKLQNLLLDAGSDRRSQLKLIDFGYGSRYVGALPMRTKCGTPYTTAPEVLRECYDQRCDVWSMGVVLFIMLSGKRPFEPLDVVGPLSEAGRATMMTNILAGRYHFDHPNWRNVSDDAKLFVKSLLHPHYTSRMYSHEALQVAWLSGKRPSMQMSLRELETDSGRFVSNIKDYSKDPNSMRRTGNVAVAFGLPPSEASKMRTIFQTVDEDGSGALSRSEFFQAMHILCPTLSDQDIQLIYQTMDVNQDGQISYTEFLAASLDPRTVDIAELSKAFHLLDSDGNGVITSDELQRLESVRRMRKMNQQKDLETAAKKRDVKEGGGSDGGSGKPSTVAEDVLIDELFGLDENVVEMMAACDTNKDGVISYEEFLVAMTGSKELIGHSDGGRRSGAQSPKAIPSPDGPSPYQPKSPRRGGGDVAGFEEGVLPQDLSSPKLTAAGLKLLGQRASTYEAMSGAGGVDDKHSNRGRKDSGATVDSTGLADYGPESLSRLNSSKSNYEVGLAEKVEITASGVMCKIEERSEKSHISGGGASMAAVGSTYSRHDNSAPSVIGGNRSGLKKASSSGSIHEFGNEEDNSGSSAHHEGGILKSLANAYKGTSSNKMVLPIKESLSRDASVGGGSGSGSKEKTPPPIEEVDERLMGGVV